MLQDLGWKALQDRWRDARMMMMYKIVNGLVAITAHEYVTPAYSLTSNSIPNKRWPSELNQTHISSPFSQEALGTGTACHQG